MREKKGVFIDRSIKNDENVKALRSFYRDVTYKKYREVDNESNIQTTLEKVVERYNIPTNEDITNEDIIIDLTGGKNSLIKCYYIDEAMFNLYKSIIICLECFNICMEGAQGWAYTTRYYSQYYLGISVLSFTGNFAQLLSSNRLENNKRLENRRIEIQTDLKENRSKLIIKGKYLKCHKWVGEEYNKLREQFILPDILPTFTIEDQFICSSGIRNNETYGRDGFLEIQYYNKSVEEFTQNYSDKDDSDLEELEEMWGFICDIIQFYKSIEAKDLPLEDDKVRFLINEIVQHEEIKNVVVNIMERKII